MANRCLRSRVASCKLMWMQLRSRKAKRLELVAAREAIHASSVSMSQNDPSRPVSLQAAVQRIELRGDRAEMHAGRAHRAVRWYVWRNRSWTQSDFVLRVIAAPHLARHGDVAQCAMAAGTIGSSTDLSIVRSQRPLRGHPRRFFLHPAPPLCGLVN